MKIVLAYSGGLDTSVLLVWLKEKYNAEIIAYCADVGQAEELDGVIEKALATGASKCIIGDLKADFAANYIFPMFQANAVYEGRYLLGTSIARPCISKAMVDVAIAEGADAIAHGATGKGNDQVRFETSIHALDPDLKVIAPVRGWDLLTREDEMVWAADHSVPVPTTAAKPYSIDDNLWGRAIECGVLEDPWAEPPADIWTMTVDPTEAPDVPEEVTLAFEQGKPVALNGQCMGLVDMIVELNKICGRNGYGRIDMVENRVVGIKSHECYEAPAALAIIHAHQALETLCLDHDTLHFKHGIDQKWAETIYDGLWFSQLREALDGFCASTQEFVSGEVRFKLYKGSMTVTGRRSSYALYDYNLATYGDGDTFDRTASAGFIELHSLPSRTWSKVQGPASVFAAQKATAEIAATQLEHLNLVENKKEAHGEGEMGATA